MRRWFTLLLCIPLFLSACQTRAETPVPASPPSASATTPPTFSPATGAANFDGFDMLDKRSGWAWRGVSQLYRTDDGGARWMEILLQGRMQVVGAVFLSAQEAWLPGVPSADMKQAVFHTVDGGRTLSMLSNVPGPNASLHFTDPDHGWALNGIGAAGNVFYQVSQSLDGGHAWTQLQATSPGGQGQQPMADTIHVATGDSVSFGPQQTIWITSGYGISTPYAGLSVSTDGAKNWTELNPPLPASLLQGEPPVTVAAPQFVTATDAYLPLTVGSHLVIFASHDAGDSWALLPPVLPSNQMHPTVQFVSLESGFAVCGSSLCATQDGGLSWTQIPTPFVFEPSANGSFVAQFDFVDEEDGWAILAAPDGTRSLLKTADGGRTWIKLEFRPGF